MALRYWFFEVLGSESVISDVDQDDDTTLNAGLLAVTFQEIWTSIALNPYFLSFSWGADPLPPFLDQRMDNDISYSL